MRRTLPLALLALAACIDDLAPQYRVTDLRVLALRAEVVPIPAEGPTFADALPGDTLRLEALVANPLGRGPLTVTWYACLPGATDAVPACVDEATLRDPGAFAALAQDPTTSGVLALGIGESVSVPIPDASDARVAGALGALVQRAVEQPTYACSLYAEIPVVAIAEAEGRREVAVKRVRLTPDPATLDASLRGDYVRNANPSMAGLSFGPSEDTCGPALDPASFPAGRIFLCGGAAADAAQPYNATCDDAGVPIVPQSDESLSWQWYVTDGEFPEIGGVGNATGGSPEFERPPAAFTLWAILRDGRGGVAWTVLPDIAAVP